MEEETKLFLRSARTHDFGSTKAPVEVETETRRRPQELQISSPVEASLSQPVAVIHATNDGGCESLQSSTLCDYVNAHNHTFVFNSCPKAAPPKSRKQKIKAIVVPMEINDPACIENYVMVNYIVVIITRLLTSANFRTL